MNKKMVIGAFIAFIMIASIFGVIIDQLASPAKKIKYNDYKFTRTDQQYVTSINGKQHSFSFFPKDLEAIEVTEDVKTLLQQPALTVTYDPNSPLTESMAEAQYYIEVQLTDTTIERAVTDNTNIELPKKSCADATAEQPVIEFRQAEESGIRAENNCIIISALDAYDLYQQTERIIYVTLGVMQ